MRRKIIDIICDVSGDELVKKNENIDLIENDILDSLAFLNLVTRLEDEFDIEIQLTQIDPLIWHKVDTIVEYITNSIQKGE